MHHIICLMCSSWSRGADSIARWKVTVARDPKVCRAASNGTPELCQCPRFLGALSLEIRSLNEPPEVVARIRQVIAALRQRDLFSDALAVCQLRHSELAMLSVVD